MNSSATLIHKPKRAPYFRQPNVFSNHSRQPSARLTPPTSLSPSLLDSNDESSPSTAPIKRLSPRGTNVAAGLVTASSRTHTRKPSTNPLVAPTAASCPVSILDDGESAASSAEHSKAAELDSESASASVEEELPGSTPVSLPVSNNVSPSRNTAAGMTSRPSAEIELMPDPNNTGHLHPHHSSRFHADALSTWNAYGYAAAHLCFLGSAAYLILDQVTDFSEHLDSQSSIYLQASQNLFLTVLFVIDAILYYKGSMYAPWRLEPGTTFNVLPQEFYNSRLGRLICCGRGTQVTYVQSRVVEVRPRIDINATMQQIQPTRFTPEREPELISRTVSSTLVSSTPSDNSPQKFSPTISHTNTIVRKEGENPHDKMSLERSASPPAVNPSSLHQALAALPPIHSPDELGYFFPLSCGGLGEAFNIIASLVWFSSALYALYPVLNPSTMQDTETEHSYIRVQHSLDVLCMVFWTLSSVFYHRDWQLNYTHGDYWYMQLDGSASVANIIASLLYLYACGLASYLGKQLPHSWRLVGTTPMDATTQPLDTPSWMSHLWEEMYWCALLADILYVLSALLYEISDYRHSRRVKQVEKERARLYELQLTLIAAMRHNKQQLYNKQKEAEAAKSPILAE